MEEVEERETTKEALPPRRLFSNRRSPQQKRLSRLLRQTKVAMNQR